MRPCGFSQGEGGGRGAKTAGSRGKGLLAGRVALYPSSFECPAFMMKRLCLEKWYNMNRRDAELPTWLSNPDSLPLLSSSPCEPKALQVGITPLGRGQVTCKCRQYRIFAEMRTKGTPSRDYSPGKRTGYLQMQTIPYLCKNG